MLNVFFHNCYFIFLEKFTVVVKYDRIVAGRLFYLEM